MISKMYCEFTPVENDHHESETQGILGFVDMYGNDNRKFTIADIRQISGYWRIRFRMKPRIWNRMAGTLHKEYIYRIEAMSFSDQKHVNEWVNDEVLELKARRWLFE